MTDHPDLFASLAAPFGPDEVKSREGQGRKSYRYVTARTVMNRLDDVLGPENWWDAYESHTSHVLCTLTIRLGDGTTIAKCDAGGGAGMADEGDDDKSAHSDALKRAAVKFGVGRYLYGDGVPAFAAGTPHTADDPAARPPKERRVWPGASPRELAPTTGNALYRWAKDRPGVMKFLAGWGEANGLAGRMIDWDKGQVAAAYAEASRKLRESRAS